MNLASWSLNPTQSKKMRPKRYNQIERVLNILDRSGTADILNGNPHFLFIFKKTERLVAALYLVTGLLSDSEPIKWEIRVSGTRLLRHILSFTEHMAARSKESISDTLIEVACLLSLLDLAHAADFLSPMNASMLRNELHIILRAIEERRHAPSLSAFPSILKESFFGIPGNVFFRPQKTENKAATTPLRSVKTAKGDTATFRTLEELEDFERNQKDIYKGHNGALEDVLYKRTHATTEKGLINLSKKSMSRPLLRQVKEERKQSILAMLRQRNSATIKDFSLSISDCSGKTIQRLLIEMVQDSVLKREGKRRWSRYSIPDKEEIVL